MHIENQDKPQYISSLTGIRAVAAIFVYLHHFNPIDKNSEYRLLYNLINELHIGVTIFFVLSGFLISYRYYETIKSNQLNLFQYFQNRVARIYPMYFLLTTLTFLVVFYRGDYKSFGLSKQLILYVANITFLKGFFDDLKFTLIAQGWSLTVEECFYFTAPIILMLLSKKRFYFILLPFILIAMGSILVITLGKVNLFGFFNTFKFMFIYTYFGRCVEFFVGILLAILILNKKKLLIKGTTYISIIGILICIVAMSSLKVEGKSGLSHPFGIFINNIILPIAIMGFFWGLIIENTFVRKILSTRTFGILGKSSFIFYLIHMGIFHTLISDYITGNYILVFLSLQLISIFLFTFIEEPLNNVIRKINFGNQSIKVPKLT